MKKNFPKSNGELVYLHLDLDDLSTIKKSAEEFLSKENKLDVLWNNAGVMVPPQGSKTKQGYELQLGTNNVAPFLFTKLLTPTLVKTAKSSPPGSVRVVWVSSSAAEMFSPPGGVDLENLDYKVDKGAWPKYGVSKAGNLLHSKEFAKRFPQIVSVVCFPFPQRQTIQYNTDDVARISSLAIPETSKLTFSNICQDGNKYYLTRYYIRLSTGRIPSYFAVFPLKLHWRKLEPGVSF